MDDLEALGTGLEGVPVPALVSDLVTGTAISANSGAVDLLGTPADKLIGSDVISFVHPEERGAAGGGLAALASGAVDAFQVRNRRVVHADGAAVAVDISGRRLESETRRLALWVFAPADQEKTVGHECLPDEVVFAVTDHNWQLEYISADPGPLSTAGEALVGTGLVGTALLGTALLGLVHPSAAAEFVEAVSRAVADRITVSLATRLHLDNAVWIERQCLLIPMCEHDPPRLGIVVTAIATPAGSTPTEVIASHARLSTVDTRAADALDTLGTMIAHPGFPELSARQIEILSRVVQGDAVDDIAAALFLSPSTVRNHLTALYRKFGVHSRAELLAHLLRTSSTPNPQF